MTQAPPREESTFRWLWRFGLVRSVLAIGFIGMTLLQSALTAYATNGAAAALDDWLTARGGEPGPLFVPVNKGGRILDHRMTGQAIMSVVSKRARQAGVAHVSPHDLRRTFVSDLLDAGADITTVSKLAGHASVTTTSRYDRRGEVAKKKAAELLHVPYQARSAT